MSKKKVSTTIYLTDEQVTALDKLHKVTRISKAELVRMSINDLFRKYEATLNLEPAEIPKIIDPIDSKKFVIGDKDTVIS